MSGNKKQNARRSESTPTVLNRPAHAAAADDDDVAAEVIVQDVELPGTSSRDQQQQNLDDPEEPVPVFKHKTFTGMFGYKDKDKNEYDNNELKKEIKDFIKPFALELKKKPLCPCHEDASIKIKCADQNCVRRRQRIKCPVACGCHNVKFDTAFSTGGTILKGDGIHGTHLRATRFIPVGKDVIHLIGKITNEPPSEFKRYAFALTDIEGLENMFLDCEIIGSVGRYMFPHDKNNCDIHTWIQEDEFYVVATANRDIRAHEVITCPIVEKIHRDCIKKSVRLDPELQLGWSEEANQGNVVPGSFRMNAKYEKVLHGAPCENLERCVSAGIKNFGRFEKERAKWEKERLVQDGASFVKEPKQYFKRGDRDSQLPSPFCTMHPCYNPAARGFDIHYDENIEKYVCGKPVPLTLEHLKQHHGAQLPCGPYSSDPNESLLEKQSTRQGTDTTAAGAADEDYDDDSDTSESLYPHVKLAREAAAEKAKKLEAKEAAKSRLRQKSKAKAKPKKDQKEDDNEDEEDDDKQESPK